MEALVGMSASQSGVGYLKRNRPALDPVPVQYGVGCLGGTAPCSTSAAGARLPRARGDVKASDRAGH